MYEGAGRDFAIVIGADRPLAAEVCRALARDHGLAVVATASAARLVPPELRRLGVARQRLDPFDERQVRRFFNEIPQYGRLVSVAYLVRPSPAVWDFVLEVPEGVAGLFYADVIAPWTCLAYAYRNLVDAGGRSMVLGLTAPARDASNALRYSVSHAALKRYAQQMKAELPGRGKDAFSDVGFAAVEVDWDREQAGETADVVGKIVRAMKPAR